MPWDSAISAAWSTSPWRMTLAPSGGSGESQAFSVATTTCAGSSASAPPPQPWPRITETVGHGHRGQGGDAAGDLAGDGALLGLGRELGARGVDDGDERQARAPRPAACRAGPRAGRRRRAASRGSGWTRSWPTSTHGWPSSRVSVDEHGGVLLALLGAVQREGAAGAVPQQVAYAEPLGRPGQLHRLPHRPAAATARRTARAARVGRRVDEHRQGPVEQHRAGPRSTRRRRSRPSRRGSRPAARRDGNGCPSSAS